MFKSHLRVWLWMNFYTIFRWITATFFIVLTLLALTFAVFTICPLLENRYLPVISSFTITEWKIENRKLEITPVIDKERLCALMGIDAYVTEKGPGDRFEKVGLITSNPIGSSPRPVGVQISSDWKMDIPDDVGEGSEFFFIYTYHCHPFWPSQVMTRKFTLPVAGQDLQMGDYVSSTK